MVLSILLLLIILWGFLQTDWGQNWLARQVTKRFSTELKTHISIKHVRLGFFDKMDLDSVLIEDQRNDTLLFAGTVQVKITDWFFFKDTADLKYVGLSNAVVYLNRTDSVWNYNFLEKYFASADTVPKKAGIQFTLKKVVMNNVTFIQKDAWTGNDLIAKVGSLNMDAEEISASKKNVIISSLDLETPYFYTFSYPARKPKSIDSVITPSGSPPAWNIVLKKVKITNGQFKTDKANSVAVAGVFDANHMDFSQINGTFKNVGWAKNTIKGTINIATRERSGLVIKSLKANTTFHPTGMLFEDLYLQTNNSLLTDYFSMQYEKGMGNFVHDVLLEANFKNASLASDDIAFFAPGTKNWNRIIKIDGRIKGTVDALNAKDLEVWAGNKTYINGNISIIGLPNINETLINLEAKDLRTTYADAVSFIPSLRKVTTPNLSRLSYLQFKGTYTGFVNNFVTFGTIKTPLGTLKTDLNMKFLKGSDPVYSGTLSTDGFQVGKFVNSDKIGVVNFHGKIKGKGFQWQTLDVALDGSIPRFQYGSYTYQNITVKGGLSNKKFNGDFDIKDPNADAHLTGLIDLTGKTPLFDIKANVVKAHLQALQLTKADMQLSGSFDLNMRGNSLSDLLGSARITNALLLRNSKEFKLDSLVVTSQYVDGLKILKLNADQFDAAITGNFDLTTLPKAFTVFLSRYYPSYIKAPLNVKPQTFTFDITTGVVEDYLSLIDTSLTGFNNSHITGSLNTIANTMAIDADVPQFSYKQYQFSDVKLKGSGTLEKLLLTGQVNNAIVSEKLNFPQTTFTIEAQQDVSNITVTTTANQTINQASLSAQIKTFSDGLSVLFNPSSFVLNGKNWSIEQGGELNFRKNTVVQGQVLLKESNQEIRLQTVPSSIGNWNDLHVALRNINLGDISPFIFKTERLEGLLKADIVVEDPQKKFNVTATLHTDELRLDNDSIGQVEASVNYVNKTGMLTGKGKNLDPEHHIDFDLAMNFKDSANIFQDRISLHPRDFQLKYLERFLGTLFTDIQGYLTGDINILGEGANRDYTAKVKLKDAGLKVVFTQVFYKIDDTEIELKKDLIDLNGIRLRDKDGNAATIKGNIKHRSFQDMYFDVFVQTETRQMELLNTTYTDNQQFYGRAKGSGTFVLIGPQSDMLISIDAKASQTDSSWITLPPSRTRESGLASFMVERKYGKEMNPAIFRGSATNLKYEITVTANPMVNMEVILDELTGDIIRGRGNGILTMNAGTTTPLTINGRYNIEEGNYLFTFQSFFKKPFVLRKGANNYIEWNGDPYKAHINLEAVYTAENVSFAPLKSLDPNAQINLASFRENVDVIANMTGELFQPTFTFKLEFPKNSLIYRSPYVSFGIQQIQKNPNELNKQVTFLIVFNSFAPYENVQSTTSPVGEALSNTISGLLFGEINNRINELLSKVLQRNNLTLNFTGSLYNRYLLDANAKNSFRINQGDINVKIGKSLLDGRLNFTVGGTFDVPIQSDFQQNVRLFPDVSVELFLNKSGSVRAVFFYHENVNFLILNATGNLQTRSYGARLTYGKEFDSFGNNSSDKKKKKKKGRGKLKK